MGNAERYLTFVVVLNAVVVVLHGVAHLEVQILPPLLDDLFIGFVIGLAPILALLLILKSSVRVGGLLLLISIACSLIYGVYNHFLTPGSDNASSMIDGGWSGLFLVTALLLPVTETVGFVSAILLTF